MIKRKPNWEIVISALQAGEKDDYTIEFPNGHTYGWLDGHLCEVLGVWNGPWSTQREPDEYRWVVSQASFNYIVEMCEMFSDEQITQFVFRTVMTTRREGMSR